MNVLALTILISICLTAIFIIFFVAELKKPRRRGWEHHALMPLDSENQPSSTSKISAQTSAKSSFPTHHE